MRMPRFALDQMGSGGLALRRGRLRYDFVFDVAQAVLAEIDFVTDEEGWRAERAARDRSVGVFDQLLLDVVLLGAGGDAIDVESGRQKRIAEGLGIVHLLGL